MAIIEKTTVTKCYHSCPLYRNSMDGMYCGHPYWNDKEAYASMIINHNNSHDRIPEKCPLRDNNCTHIIRL